MYIIYICFIKPKQKQQEDKEDESGFSFDPDADNEQLKGAFNNYVDTLFVKNCSSPFVRGP